MLGSSSPVALSSEGFRPGRRGRTALPAGPPTPHSGIGRRRRHAGHHPQCGRRHGAEPRPGPFPDRDRGPGPIRAQHPAVAVPRQPGRPGTARGPVPAASRRGSVRPGIADQLRRRPVRAAARGPAARLPAHGGRAARCQPARPAGPGPGRLSGPAGPARLGDARGRAAPAHPPRPIQPGADPGWAAHGPAARCGRGGRDPGAARPGRAGPAAAAGPGGRPLAAPGPGDPRGSQAMDPAAGLRRARRCVGVRLPADAGRPGRAGRAGGREAGRAGLRPGPRHRTAGPGRPAPGRQRHPGHRGGQHPPAGCGRARR